MLALACWVLAFAGCRDDGEGSAGEGPALTRDELLDPQTCAGCHPRHYRQWKRSMHAHAAADPVFLAMNRRGQEETGGDLGPFCVRCHAPMAVLEGATDDGLNLAEVPEELQGVTCYFCHAANGVFADHNNGVRLAGGRGDRTMRGGIRDPEPTRAHASAFSPLHAGREDDSAALCGSCHDVKTPAGLHLERTYAEYRASIYAAGDDPVTCNGCHMSGEAAPVAEVPGRDLPARTFHDHGWAAVGVPLGDWPDSDAQRRAVLCALAEGTLLHTFQIHESGELAIQLETTAGHVQPSGASHARRLWGELLAYDAGGEVIFASGRVADDEVVVKPESHPAHDPHLQWLGGQLFDAEGTPTHMLWDAASSPAYPEGFTGRALPAPRPGARAHTVTLAYALPELPERVTFRARLRPIGLDVLDDLIASGHLDAEVRGRMPTFTLQGTVVEWRREDGFAPIIRPSAPSLDCADAD